MKNISPAAVDYFNAFVQLLPPGPAWGVADSADASGLIDGLSQEFGRLQAAADGLIDEADPRTTYQLLPDFNRIFGLSSAATIAQQRLALQAQMTAQGGQTDAYFVALAATAGYSITISHYPVFTMRSKVNDPMLGPAWAYAFLVHAPANTVLAWSVLSGVGDALAVWGNTALEALINKHKPAHTVALFSYS